MKYELLLHWASERGAGTWAEFRDAHDWLFNTGEPESPPSQNLSSVVNTRKLSWNLRSSIVLPDGSGGVVSFPE